MSIETVIEGIAELTTEQKQAILAELQVPQRLDKVIQLLEEVVRQLKIGTEES